MKGNLSIVIASDTEREDLFAEIYRGDTQVAEVANDPKRGVLVVEVFCPPSAGALTLDLDDLQEALAEGRRRLAQMGYPEGGNNPTNVQGNP